MSEYAVQMKNINKTFGKTVALKNAKLIVKKGEIHAILGENGAGKTTLMKILYGMTKLDSGEIELYGKDVKIANTHDAISRGIGMVHQHFMLADVFTVMENVVVGAEPTKKAIINRSVYEKSVGNINERLNFKLDLNKKVEDLSVGQKQRVEIMKALYRGAEILILDEPTAVLTPAEVDEFFIMLKQLKAEGKSVILITHKLHEIMQVADKVTVMRDAEFIDEKESKDMNEEKLAKLMVGRDIVLGRIAPPEPGIEPLFEIKNLSYKSESVTLDNINLTLCKKEILGIAGVDGNGQSELIEAITGIAKTESLTVLLNGNKIEGDVNDFINAKIGHVPEDRNKRGSVGEMSVQENLILGYHKKNQFGSKGIFNLSSIENNAKEVIKNFSIKTSGSKMPIKSLSGGNAQKVIIGRVFSQSPEVVIAAQPTRGVDISAAEYIHDQMLSLRDKGKGVLLISADLNEVRKLSDRIAVMFEGKIVDIRKADEYSDMELGMLMVSGKIAEGSED
ncbi:MAG: ABC transporter ATP-binding protein [Lachnospirales bacterium]